MARGTPSKTTRAPDVGAFAFGDVEVAPGEVRDVDLLAARLPTSTTLSIPVRILHGRRPGPALWLSAALHGDELNGVEIVRRVLAQTPVEDLRGTLIAVPIVNAFGFLEQSRYLPDGRDLNRSFPGSKQGSLAARIASLFVREIVKRSAYGIDLHTSTRHRTNFPQIRCDLEDAATREFAASFGAPVTLHSKIRDGSLRQTACREQIPVLVYEGGEAQRFDAGPIAVGVRGVRQALAHLGMIKRQRTAQRCETWAWESAWVRSPRGGILRVEPALGDRVEKGDVIARIGDAFGDDTVAVRAPHAGRVIATCLNPLVHQGDGVMHLTKRVEE